MSCDPKQTSNDWDKEKGDKIGKQKAEDKRPNVLTLPSIKGPSGCELKDHTKGKVQCKGPN